MIVTQAVNEFFLSEDIENFAIKNDDSSLVAETSLGSCRTTGCFPFSACP